MYENLSQPMPLQKEIKLYTGTGNPALAEKVADILHLELQGLKIEKFANGEIYARFDESVRGDDVFFIQSLSGANVNDLLMETLVVADAAKRASARSISAVRSALTSLNRPSSRETAWAMASSCCSFIWRLRQ